MLDRMEKAKLIRRVPDQKNRRQIFIEITEKARSYQQKYDALSTQMNAIFYAGFTDEEIENFEKKLQKIVENLESTWNYLQIAEKGSLQIK